jgi:hypothetical protein
MRNKIAKTAVILEKEIAKVLTNSVKTNCRSKNPCNNSIKTQEISTFLNESKNSQSENISRFSNKGNYVATITTAGIAMTGFAYSQINNDGSNSRIEPNRSKLYSENTSNNQKKQKYKNYIINRIAFDSDVNEDKKNEIVQEFSDLIDDSDKKPLIKDVIETISDENNINFICFSGRKININTKSGPGSLTGEIDGVNKNIFVYDVNDRPTKKIISSAIHECAHSMQNLLTEKLNSSNNPFLNGTLITSMNIDQQKSFNAPIANSLVDDIVGQYDESFYGNEIHSRFMELYYEDTNKAKELFPTTMRSITKIHNNIKSSLKNEKTSYVNRLIETRQQSPNLGIA